MTEFEVQEKVTEFATLAGLLPIRINVTGRKGWPDYGYVYKGRICFIEFKKPGERPTPLQLYVHDALIKQGCFVYVVDDIDEGKMLLRDWMKHVDTELARIR